MFELFAMSLREYLKEAYGGDMDADNSVSELQKVLSDHYGKEISWDEVDKSGSDEEVSVDVIDDRQLSALQAVAAKLELDGKIDGLVIDPEEPWESEVFERLEDELGDEESDRDVEKFCHILAIGNSFEFFCIPADLPFVAQICINNDEDDECDCDDKCCHCHDHEDDDDDECCCEEDDGSVDVSSLPALRRELDEIAKALDIDTNVNIDETDPVIDDEDPYRYAKIGWYILSAKLNDAIKEKLPLIVRFNDDEDDYDDLDDDDDAE